MSFALTPSPSGTFLPLRKPATACSSMSTTSSAEPAAVREAGVVAAEHAHPVGLRRRRGGIERLSRSSSAKVVAGEGDLRDAGAEHGDEVVAPGLRDAELVELVQHGGQDRGLVVLLELRVVVRASVRFQRSFSPVGMTTSLISGSPRRETCVQPR